jgi:ribosomal protein S27AE
MNIRIAYQASSRVELMRPKCPHCGATVLMAERAAFNPDGRIRHTWSCDDCGHEFVTSIAIHGRQPRRSIAS